MNQGHGTRIDIVDEAVATAFDGLLATVAYNFDSKMAFVVEVCVSVVSTLMLKDVSNPVGLILIDNPSTGKTTALSMFYDLPMVYRSDAFTPASFVSHAANVKRKKLEEIDLLPRIKHKCLVVPEMAPFFSQRLDDLTKSVGILTRVFDGEGYWSDSGTHGGRGYREEFPFAMLGATTPISKAVWKVMGQFGSRLLFLTLNSSLNAEERLAKSFSDVFFRGAKSFKERVAECRAAASHFFTVLTDQVSPAAFAHSVHWDTNVDPRDLKLQISIISEFAASARSKVATWDSKSRDAKNSRDFSQPLKEGPQRITAILYSLARAHAVARGRRQMNQDDMPLIIETALSSMPYDRRQVVNLLLGDQSPTKACVRGQVSSSDIEESLTISRPTAIRIIDELTLLGIGRKTPGNSNQPCTLTIDHVYDWLISDQFASYRCVWQDIQTGPC